MNTTRLLNCGTYNAENEQELYADTERESITATVARHMGHCGLLLLILLRWLGGRL